MQTPDLRRARWLYPLLGALSGILYSVLDEGIMDQTPGMPGWAHMLHEFLDFILPFLLGACLGLCVYFIRLQKRFSRRLSLKFDRLRQDLLFNTLISQMLHEIQNPLHNLTAALEDDSAVSTETRQLVRRNLARLGEIKTRYGQWGAVLDHIDPEEPVELSEFIRKFFDEKIGGQLRTLNVAVHFQLPPIRVFIHPVFLEQILAGLLTNALAALEKTPGRRSLTLESALKNSRAFLRVANTGAFAAETLDAQGRRPSPSREGLGLGLLLARSLLEQVGGSIGLANENGLAVATIELRGENL